MIDLGGGTLDVAVVRLSGGVVEVRAATGENDLGGDDWDQRIAEWLMARFAEEHGVDLVEPHSVQRIRDAAVAAKLQLSRETQTTVNLTYLASSQSVPRHLMVTLTRSEFEGFTADLLDRCRVRIEQGLKMAEVGADELDDVLLVGGATRMPAAAALVRRLTGRDPVAGVDPDEATAAGAALQAGMLTADVREVAVLEVTPLALGVETAGTRTTIISANSAVPTKRSQVFTTTRNNQATAQVRLHQFAPMSRATTRSWRRAARPAARTTWSDLHRGHRGVRRQRGHPPPGPSGGRTTLGDDHRHRLPRDDRRCGPKAGSAVLGHRPRGRSTAAPWSSTPPAGVLRTPSDARHRLCRFGCRSETTGSDLVRAVPMSPAVRDVSPPGQHPEVLITALLRRGAAMREASDLAPALVVGREAVATAVAFARQVPGSQSILIRTLVELSTTQYEAGLLDDARKACSMAVSVVLDAGGGVPDSAVAELSEALIRVGTALATVNRNADAIGLLVAAFQILNLGRRRSERYAPSSWPQSICLAP
ncbi:hypothetical protein GCM10010492_67130 [Saccharothrix mutabilis subsp. mutabilis]|uniref:Uncharacterized protein n=1 Tax=Saccharothrix mutabilis subsp. mutabilis TaxID=66855 RepID=A0ABN0UNW9_9PSEU